MTTPEQLAAADRAYVVAAAGCGKTRLIVDAVDSDTSRRHLVLTHTNAGVEVLRRRLQERGIRDDRAHVQTIAGFALLYASAYPQRSLLPSEQPRGPQYRQVITGATDVLATAAIRKVIARTYGSVFVDEYQDCTQSQHELVLRLADVVPTRVLGDPYQGIFDFNDEPLVGWDVIGGDFDQLPPLHTPHRWSTANKQLGAWLTHARSELQAGRALDYARAPVRLKRLPAGNRAFPARLKICRDLSNETSVVAIVRRANGAHQLAKSLGGTFTSMEELECKDLDAAADRLDGASDGIAYARNLVEFAVTKCFSRTAKLNSARAALVDGRIPAASNRGAGAAAVTAIHDVASTPTPQRAATALREIARLPDARAYRLELYEEMVRALQLAATRPGLTVREAAWAVRDRSRRYGRRITGPVISRTLLVKGLEFDHAIVFADEFADSPKDLYVAITRPRQSLTIVTSR